jgi:hypothetical protein
MTDIHRLRADQAQTILDGLDREVKPATAITIARDEHGAAIVRHETLGTFRDASVRDALAQMLQALACPPTRRTGEPPTDWERIVGRTRRTGAGPGPMTVRDLELATDTKCGTLRAMKG